jgi:protein translocase SecG subunit
MVTMVTMLSSVLIALAVILIILVLLQRAGTDASGAFSSDGGTGALLEKRGAEKVLHRATILVAVIFVCTALAHLFVA